MCTNESLNSETIYNLVNEVDSLMIETLYNFDNLRLKPFKVK